MHDFFFALLKEELKFILVVPQNLTRFSDTRLQWNQPAYSFTPEATTYPDGNTNNNRGRRRPQSRSHSSSFPSPRSSISSSAPSPSPLLPSPSSPSPSALARGTHGSDQRRRLPPQRPARVVRRERPAAAGLHPLPRRRQEGHPLWCPRRLHPHLQVWPPSLALLLSWRSFGFL
jgi:hypothetical protein